MVASYWPDHALQTIDAANMASCDITAPHRMTDCQGYTSGSSYRATGGKRASLPGLIGALLECLHVVHYVDYSLFVSFVTPFVRYRYPVNDGERTGGGEVL